MNSWQYKREFTQIRTNDFTVRSLLSVGNLEASQFDWTFYKALLILGFKFTWDR